MRRVTDAKWDESICKKPTHVHSISVTYLGKKPAAVTELSHLCITSAQSSKLSYVNSKQVCLRCSGKCYMHFIENLTIFAAVKNLKNRPRPEEVTAFWLTYTENVLVAEMNIPGEVQAMTQNCWTFLHLAETTAVRTLRVQL